MTTDQVRIEPGDPGDPAFVRLHEALDSELGELYPPESIYSVAPNDLDAPGCCLLLARTSEGEAVACGALRRLASDAGEIKRMYVAPEHRRKALGRRILEDLEARAVAFGYKSLRLETGLLQPAAVGLYRSFGYVKIPRYAEYADDPHSLCFEKRLGTMTSAPDDKPAGTMERRRALQVIGGAAAMPLLPAELFANPHLAHVHLHRQEEAAGEPQPLTVLTEHQARTLNAIAERILPTTDTPGAGDAEIPAFVDRLLEGWLPETARRHLLSELDRFDARAGERRPDAASFVDLSGSEQDALLAEAQDEAIAQRDGRAFSRSPNRLHQQPFFDLVKWLTLFGYYTSEAGMKSELGYRIVPGRWDPCVDVEEA